MEYGMNSTSFGSTYKGKRVLVTGHTGFKGSWLTAWLLELGAEVAGYSDGVPTQPSHFESAGLEGRVTHVVEDMRDRAAISRLIAEWRPEVVFHLAAQALVRPSYEDPATTFETNTLGTLNVLEAVRVASSVRALVLITSDKAYRNVEWVWGYRESDMLGGDDPYSGSKGAAELVAHSYMRSYFEDPTRLAVATARAGNVIGGGDWAADRLVPDCVRAWSSGDPVVVRAPSATRPWQHVLEPLSGYLWLGARLLERDRRVCGESFNFGPDASVSESVGELIQRLARGWPGARSELDPSGMAGRPEARLLRLSCDKALLDLAWRATLSFGETVDMTTEWYRGFYEGEGDIWALTARQIAHYEELAGERGQAWRQPG